MLNVQHDDDDDDDDDDEVDVMQHKFRDVSV